jgi:hypothetical protein
MYSKEVFLFAAASILSLLSTQSPTKCVPDALFSGINQPKHKADHSPPSSVEVKNTWICTSTPPYVLIVLCLMKQRIYLREAVLVKHRENFNFTFTLCLRKRVNYFVIFGNTWCLTSTYICYEFGIRSFLHGLI